MVAGLAIKSNVQKELLAMENVWPPFRKQSIFWAVNWSQWSWSSCILLAFTPAMLFFCQNIHGKQKFIHVWGGKACQAEFRASWEHYSQRGNSWIIQSLTYPPPPHQQFTLGCAPIRENCGKQKHFRLQTKAIATVWAIVVIRHPPLTFTCDIKLSVSWCRQAGSRPQEPRMPNVPFIYPCFSSCSYYITSHFMSFQFHVNQILPTWLSQNGNQVNSREKRHFFKGILCRGPGSLTQSFEVSKC